MRSKKSKNQEPQEKHEKQLNEEECGMAAQPVMPTMETGPAPELRAIKKRIKKRNVRLITAAAAVCLCAVLAFQFAVTPLLNLCFYRPDKNSYAPSSPYYSDFYMGLSAFTELHFPGRQFSYVEIDNTGIGKYQLNIIASDWTKKPIGFSSSLVRGRLSLPSEFWFDATTIPTRAFSRSSPDWLETDAEKLALELRESAAYLQTLPDYLVIKAHLSFREDRSMEELAALYNAYAGSSGPALIWAGIRNSEEIGMSRPQTGISPAGFGEVLQVSDLYPAFSLSSALEQQEGKADGALYETHFRSLLKYLTDHPGFLKALGGDIDRTGDYRAISAYIEKNGVRTYGVTAVGSPSALLAFCQKEGIEKITIEDLTFRKN